MKSPSSTIHYASKQDYLNRRPAHALKKVADAVSDKAIAPKATKGDVKESIKDVKEKVESKVSEAGSAGKHLISQAGGSLVRGLTSMVTPSLPSVGVEIETTVTNKVTQTGLSETKQIDKPGIFFVKGFSLNPFEKESDGLGQMSKNIPSAEIFKWDNKNEIIQAIKARPEEQAIILVGHGMGGDTIVDVANELNSVEHGFRKVNLLVTMDSIGTDNDIIPPNVADNFNMISDQDSLINDGPNVARKRGMTYVTNELRPEGHNEMEGSPEVQFLVYEKINQALMQAVAKKDIAKRMDQAFRERMLNSHQLNFNPATKHLKQLIN